MTNQMKRIARRAGRRSLRSARVAPGQTNDLVSALPVEAQHTTDAMRTVFAHTSAGWNSLRHAC
jgi:hypothetical protein